MNKMGVKMITITKDNEHMFNPPERVYGHSGGGRHRKLWMKQFCKRYPKKSGFQGFAHVDLRRLVKYGKCKVR